MTVALLRSRLTCLTVGITLMSLQLSQVSAASNSECQLVVTEWDEALLPCGCDKVFPSQKNVKSADTCEQRVSWFQEHGGHIGDCSQTGVYIQEGFEDHMTIGTDKQLLIYAANVSNSDRFECRVLGEETAYISLTVEVPPGNPEITSFPSRLIEGNKYSLFCLVPRVKPTESLTTYWTTNSLPYVQATIINETLNADGTSRVTTQATVTFSRQDHQTYAWCVTTWKDPAQIYENSSQILDIMFPASTNDIAVYPDGIGHEDEQLNFTCNTSSSHPQSKIMWFIGNTNISDNARVNHQLGAFGGWETTSTVSVVLSREFNKEMVQCQVVHEDIILESLTQEYRIQMTFPPSDTIFEEFPKGAQREGFTQEFTCVTDSSNPDSHIEWYVEGVNFTHLAKKTHQDGEYGGRRVSSTLGIRLFREHTGFNVSCIPIYSGLEQETLERHTRINTTYPAGVHVEVVSMATEGQEVIISCVTENGNPGYIDDVTWKFRPKHSNVDPGVSTCTGKTCRIPRVGYHHAGIYECVAKNWNATLSNIGAAALDVQYTARLVENMTILDVYAYEGETVLLEAKLRAWPPDVSVRCKMTDLEEMDQSLIGVERTGDEELSLAILLTDVNYQRHDHIGCFGHSSAGESIPISFNIHRPGPPEKPSNVHVEHKTANSIQVSFTAGLDGGFPQTFSLLYRRLQDLLFTEHFTQVANPGKGNTSSIKLPDLEADMAYDIMVRATNNFTGGNNSTADSEDVNVPTKREPVVEDISVSEDGEWTVVTWNLDEVFHYTNQVIQKCEGIVNYKDLACKVYDIEHGDSARLLLDKKTHYSVHLLLYDRDDEVFRALVYLDEIPGNDSSASLGWMVGCIVVLILFVASGTALVILYRRRRRTCTHNQPGTGAVPTNTKKPVRGETVRDIRTPTDPPSQAILTDIQGSHGMNNMAFSGSDIRRPPQPLPKGHPYRLGQSLTENNQGEEEEETTLYDDPTVCNSYTPDPQPTRPGHHPNMRGVFYGNHALDPSHVTRGIPQTSGDDTGRSTPPVPPRHVDMNLNCGKVNERQSNA